ncbi:MAG TPA: AmmeMemoRadiSam system protein B [Candidatus Aquilonibacter sp.]|nr:AmmeMemoRadiSam system protein B [Candidatus Aquilonibacter sp.]
MIRPPAVAGKFYPSDPQELARQIDRFTAPAAEALAPPKIVARACLVPHAGYMYSGHVAGAIFASIEIPSRCILLGPRHYPRGESMAILTEGSFATPFGEAPVDAALAREIADACPRLREDALAHEREHSLEVEIPFLQRLAENFAFVPIVLGTDRYPPLESLARAIAGVVAARAQRGERILIIASSDMNHYECDAVTRAKDALAIARILALDPEGLYHVVRHDQISMCGYAATVAMLAAVRELGAAEARLVRYATSGDISGDHDHVVGYAGIVIP